MSTPVSGPIDLTDRVAIVTGASRGIGQASCEALAREGAYVAACDVLPSEETVKKIRSKGREVLEIRCNVVEKASIQKAVDQVIHAWGKIDILVNNAGILGNSRRLFEEYSEEEWDLLLQTNLRGTFLMTQAVWPYMKKQGGGKVVCLGSIAGRIGGLLAGPHYCASKGGIHAFVKWAA